jgi:hypothetical protein
MPVTLLPFADLVKALHEGKRRSNRTLDGGDRAREN